METKEHKVGERFTLPIARIEVVVEEVPHGGCDGCYFYVHDVCQLDDEMLSMIEFCDRAGREDKTSVIFKEVPPTIEDTANSMVAAAVGNVDFAYIIAHRTIEGEITINTIGKPENISMLKERLLKILEEGK